MKNIKVYPDLLLLIVITGLLLIIPLAATVMSEEVIWNVTDFILAGAMLFGAGFTYLWVVRKKPSLLFQIATGIALGTLLMLIWVNLAVGIIGKEDHFLNKLYFIIPVIGFLGTILTRLEPRGMAITLYAMALAQGLITIIALIRVVKDLYDGTITGIIALNMFFIILFIISGWLFRKGPQHY